MRHEPRRSGGGAIDANAQLEVVRRRAAAQDAEWVRALSESGDFDFPLRLSDPSQILRGPKLWTLHPLEIPALAALASAVIPAPQDLDDPSAQTARRAAWHSPRVQFVPVAKPAMRQAFHQVVSRFLDSLPKVGDPQGRDRDERMPPMVQANCAILLGMAAAWGDELAARTIVAACPQALRTPVSCDLGLHGQESRRFVPGVEPFTLATAPFLAARAHRGAMLATFAELGWHSQDPVYFTCDHLQPMAHPTSGAKVLAERELGKPQLAWPLARCLVERGAPLLLRNQARGTLEVIISRARHDGAAGLLRHLKDVAARHATSSRDVDDALRILHGHGLLTHAANDIALEAVACGSTPLLELALPDVNWATYDDWSFLPRALATSSWLSDAPENAGRALELVCRAVVDAGFGTKLCEPFDGPYGSHAKHLLHILCGEGVTSAALIALEGGADPMMPDARGLDCIRVAEKAGHTDTAAAVRAFIAKREAQAMLREFALSPQAC